MLRQLSVHCMMRKKVLHPQAPCCGDEGRHMQRDWNFGLIYFGFGAVPFWCIITSLMTCNLMQLF